MFCMGVTPLSIAFNCERLRLSNPGCMHFTPPTASVRIWLFCRLLLVSINTSRSQCSAANRPNRFSTYFISMMLSTSRNRVVS